MIRQPAVANQFYPGNRHELSSTVAALSPDYPPDKKVTALAAIVPHAGYVYSGHTAAATFARIRIPENVIILGPNHHGVGSSLAIMSTGSWAMPMGSVPINNELSEIIKSNCNEINEDEVAHRFEHSLEVQVPFLQNCQNSLTISPIAVSRISLDQARETGFNLASAIREFSHPTLIVASTDMTHYESRELASRQDKLALDRILRLDPEGLYRTVIKHGISMCGFIPTTIAMFAAIELGATAARLIEYTDSGESSGDTSSVVGYAGLIIS